MDDIAAELRELVAYYNGGYIESCDASLLIRAADEIDRLRQVRDELVLAASAFLDEWNCDKNDEDPFPLREAMAAAKEARLEPPLKNSVGKPLSECGPGDNWPCHHCGGEHPIGGRNPCHGD